MPPLTAAQKRQKEKDKKKKEREMAAIKQEHAAYDALHGAAGDKTDKEAEVVCQALSTLNRVDVEVPGDGNCLYYALLDQQCQGRTQDRGPGEAMALRKELAAYIAAHAEQYVPFMEHDEGADVRQVVDVYCAQLVTDGVWGGPLEVSAAAAMFRVSIAVVAEAGIVVCGGDDAAQAEWVLAFYQHKYALGGHYNSTKLVARET